MLLLFFKHIKDFKFNSYL